MTCSAMTIRTRVVVDHEDLGKDTFHEWWWTNERFKADRDGRSNPGMVSADWMKVRCNNPDCAAWAIINITDVLDATLGGEPR